MTRKPATPARATILPADLAKALQEAKHWPAGEERIARIDSLTDEAALRGLVMPRTHDGGWIPPAHRAQVWGQDE